MRLRITVKRHGLPETPIVWNVDLETSTIAQLLEQVNEIIPIETSEWGFEDYAVELKGSNGVNFECLHFQQVGKAMKEDDEVIIRPLLTQDLKIRRISGRHQISADGKHLVDGLAFGRPLLRRPVDRPAINIPPRKRRRVTYHEDEDEDDDEGFLALKEKEAEGGDSEDETNDRQLVLHADFEDDDSEDDDDFVPGEDEEVDEDEEVESEAEDVEEDEEETLETEMKEQEGLMASSTKSQGGEDNEEVDDESAFADISDEETRTKIRKLHSTFPTSPMTVCTHVLDGSGGDVGEAYTTMSLGFQPAKPKSAITETSEVSISVPKTRSKKRKAPAEEVEVPDSMQVEAAETGDSMLLDYYDQNGLPPGSISSGKALSHMAEAVQSSPGKLRPTSQRSNSAVSSKIVRFSLGEGLTNGFTSTPAIDHEPHADDSEEESEESNSDATSSSGGSDSSSSEEDSSSSDESKEDAEVSDTSSSGSDSDSSSDSSSDDDAPEETSSKITNAASAKLATLPTAISPPKPTSDTVVAPGQGNKGTQSRNQRRRGANVLNRFKEKGILPAGTTRAEFLQLSEVTNDTSPEEALVALESVRNSAGEDETTNSAAAKNEEFEARRQKLLASLESGGIEVGPESPEKSPKKAKKAPSVEAEENIVDTRSSAALPSIKDPQDVSMAFSTAPETHQPFSINSALQIQAEKKTAKPESSTTPEAATPKASIASSKAQTLFAEVVSKEGTPSASATRSKPPTPASESARSNATTPRRARLDLGAGRRMLFGALGLKAPKSKKDEEKVRNELMKDVRPINTLKAAEKAPEEDAEVVTDQDPESWRKKITYRAVECCHDGVELSEPPFPFVQRWDPQQQGGWSQKGKNGGKRKKNQRDDTQYYQEERPSKKQKQRKGKHNYAEQQEYLDASYEPSYQEDSIMESEALTQESVSRLPTDDIEGEITQQLMNDLNEGASAQVSQGPEDLASLPEDPTSLPDLKDGDPKPGMTIAFKQLTMSEETKWQPEISSYRTAVVNAILDTGDLQLTLALRDRLNCDKNFDPETGERVYGRFDMPDQDEEEDEEEEDDGLRSLTFSELVEPKLVQDAPAGLGVDKAEIETDELELPKTSFSTESQNLSYEDEADVQFSHVTETPLHSEAPEPNEQDSNLESTPESPQPNGQTLDQETKEGENSELDTPDAALQQATPNPAGESGSDVSMVEDQESSAPTVDKGKSKEILEAAPAAEPVTIGENEEPSQMDVSDISITTDARLVISDMMKDAGFRSSVPSSVLKDIRPSGMESPGDAQVFEKLMKDMTEIEGGHPYSPKFHGLDPSSPIKKLRQVSTDQAASSSPARVQSSWQTVDSKPPSSPPLVNDEGESSWVTMDPEEASSPSANVLSSKRIAKKATPAKPTKKFKVPNLGKAQELWEALQPKSRRSSAASSRDSPERSTGLGGANDTSALYPKLSVTPSFTSQISDHGRQPDLNFDDSAGLSGDTPKAQAFEDDSFMNQQDDLVSDVEQELPSHKSAPSSSGKVHLEDPFLDDEEPESPPQAKVNGSAKSQSKTPEVLQGSPSSDDAFPTLEEVLSQRGLTYEITTSVRSKPAKQIKAERMQNMARAESSEDDDEDEDEDSTPKPSQKKTRQSNREHSLPSGYNVRKSPRQSQSLRSQPQASQSRPSQNRPKFDTQQASQVVDLTLTSSDVEEEEDAVLSEIDKPKRFRAYNLDNNDDDDYSEEEGRIPKKSSSQKAPETRRQANVGPKVSSQSSLNTSRMKTTARF